MQNIEITVDDKNYKIELGISEHFDELKGKSFMLSEMVAEQIEKVNDISITAKILLSAVAGAVVQYLLDKRLEFDVIFNKGKFTVCK